MVFAIFQYILIPNFGMQPKSFFSKIQGTHNHKVSIKKLFILKYTSYILFHYICLYVYRGANLRGQFQELGTGGTGHGLGTGTSTGGTGHGTGHGLGTARVG
jgi:hypothetical protein